MNSSLWRLDAVNATVLLQATGEREIPSIVWFGECLPSDVSAECVAAISNLPLPMAKLDTTVPLSIFPQRSIGMDSQPALRGHRDGYKSDHCFECVDVVAQNNGFLIELADKFAALRVSILLSLHEVSGVLSIETTLLNDASESFTVDWLASATVPLPGLYRECMHLHGRWGLEFQTTRSVIDTGVMLLQSHRGRTSHERYPGVIVGEPGFDEGKGDVIAATLAWSGCHSTAIELTSDGHLYYQSGVSLDPGELRLDPGESFSAPACHISRHATEGLNAVSHAMHQFVRSEVLPAWTRTKRPVHANSWEALYFDHDVETLKLLVDAAEKVGAERFILDDGWFPARRSDDAGLGDWQVDTSVYPAGLHPLVEHVRSKGMQFGLWFEPEMINPDSEVYRRHPHWALHHEHYDTPLARNQLVLNIDNEEVFTYLFQRIAALVKEYHVDYIKWDHNRDLILAGDGTRSRMMRQTHACYRLMDKLNSEYDWLEIESCSSGGARADWGVLKHTGRVWTSDSIDAIDRVNIQRGYSYFNPPEIMGAHVGHAKAHLTGREINIHTRAIVALQGQYGYEVDARKLDAEEIQTLQYYASLYKKHRHWMSNCRTWRLRSGENLVCSGLVSEDKQESLWFATTVASLPSTLAGTVVLEGLVADANYRVKLVSQNRDELAVFCKKLPAWVNEATVVRGALLMSIGLNLPVMPAQSSILVEASVV